MRLTPDIAVVHPLLAIAGPDACGADDVVRLEAVVLKNGARVTLDPAATLHCPMAETVVRWVREEIAPAADTLGKPARAIKTAGSYECRERDRLPDAKPSEHGRANALDLRSLTLANGTTVEFTAFQSQEVEKRLRREAKNSQG